jgi:hypothetical protein
VLDFDPKRTAPYVTRFAAVPITRGEEKSVLYIPEHVLPNDSPEAIRAEAERTIKLLEISERLIDLEQYLDEDLKKDTLEVIIKLATHITVTQMLILYMERERKEAPDGLALVIEEVDDPPEGIIEEDYFWDSAQEIARKKIESLFRELFSDERAGAGNRKR